MKEPAEANMDRKDQEGTSWDKEDVVSLLVPYWRCCMTLQCPYCPCQSMLIPVFPEY